MEEMSGGNGIQKRKNRVYRWMAAMLTAALLIGQCNVSVLAQEDTLPVGQEAYEEEKTDVGNGDALIQDSSEGNEDTDHSDDGQDGIGDTDLDSSDAGESNGSDDDVNAGAGEGDAENESTENDGAGGDDSTKDDGAGSEKDDNGDAGQDGAEAQDQCVCETACTEETVNEECPVCAANYDACVGNAGGGGIPNGYY